MRNKRDQGHVANALNDKYDGGVWALETLDQNCRGIAFVSMPTTTNEMPTTLLLTLSFPGSLVVESTIPLFLVSQSRVVKLKEKKGRKEGRRISFQRLDD